eukprot:scaffold1661_cov251-Pinguiococcus_pyrenoidosus.AAC.15
MFQRCKRSFAVVFSVLSATGGAVEGSMSRRRARGDPTPPRYDVMRVPPWDKSPKSVVLESATRTTWCASAGELAAVSAEACRRKMASAPPETPLREQVPLSPQYIADRLDIDDPLYGYMMRDRENGWLLGFVTYTTFTTWTPQFSWDSRHARAGLTSMINKLRKAEDGPREPPRAKKDARHGEDPARKSLPKVDEDGALADALNGVQHAGNWQDQGVIWDRVAEIGLVGALGCGDWLMRLVLDEIQLQGQYDFVVLDSTEGAVPFYERYGFRRVGAVARYEQKQSKEGASRLGPWCAYRHWTFGDEDAKMLRHRGGASYMMCLKVEKRRTSRRGSVAAEVQSLGLVATKRPRVKSSQHLPVVGADLPVPDGVLEEVTDSANGAEIKGADENGANGANGSRSSAARRYQVGTRVMAKWKDAKARLDSGLWFPGIVRKAHRSGKSYLYEVLYDDGDTWKKVPAELIMNEPEWIAVDGRPIEDLEKAIASKKENLKAQPSRKRRRKG